MEKKADVKSRKQVIDFIEETLREISCICSLISVYEISWKEKKYNSDDGWISVTYQPLTFAVRLFVFDGIFEEVPNEGITKSFKNYIQAGICHEIGHLYTWELDGTKNQIEKASSLVGYLIMRILKEEEEHDQSCNTRLRKDKHPV